MGHKKHDNRKDSRFDEEESELALKVQSNTIVLGQKIVKWDRITTRFPTLDLNRHNRTCKVES